MSEALKPCPFCGGTRFVRVKPYPWAEEGEGDLEWGFAVFCDASGIDGVKRGCGASASWGETESEAITAWNRRSPDAGMREALIAARNTLGIRDDFAPAGLTDLAKQIDTALSTKV